MEITDDNGNADRDGRSPALRERLEGRLKALRKEFQEGQSTIADLESRLNGVRATVLRISGAIQVLEEELGASGGDPAATEGGRSTRGEEELHRPPTQT